MAGAEVHRTQESWVGKSTRFPAFPALSNKRPETSISSLFPNSTIRNRPLDRRSNTLAIDNDELQAVSQSSSTTQESRQILTSLLETLKESHIPGPRLVRLRPESAEFCDVIGEGAQCDVLASSAKCEALLGDPLTHGDATKLAPILKACRLIAVKRTKVIGESDASPLPSHDGTKTKGLRDQLEFARRDIMTLCHDRFRRHRNIVKLVSWGLCLDTLEDPEGDVPRIPLLVLERANGNLSEYLQYERDYEGNHEAFTTELCKVCLDIGRGLEAIHDMNMTHGDLKPSNVLVFRSSAGVTAKLCDFGLAIEERKGEDAFVDYQGTPGWIPPETSEALGSASLVLCDIFAYGLVVWCIATLEWESPIENIPPKRLTEQDLYQRAWHSVKATGVVRQGQDSYRLLRVLRACLYVSPSLRERQPWLYLDRGRYFLVAPSADPTESSASLFAFEFVLKITERLSRTSSRVAESLRDSWLSMLKPRLGPPRDLLLSLGSIFDKLAEPLILAWKTVARLWHSGSLPPRQSMYEKLFKIHIRHQSVEDINRLMDDISPFAQIRIQDDASHIIQLALLDTLNALPPVQPGPGFFSAPLHKDVNVVYSLARLRSRFARPAACSPAMHLHPDLGKNPVVLAFQKAQSLDLATLAWLCRGPCGGAEIAGSQRYELWRLILQDTDMTIQSRLQLVALILHMGASPQDTVSSSSRETAFRHVLSKVMIDSYQQSQGYNETPHVCNLVCEVFRSAAVRMNTPQARFFISGELPDEDDIDESGTFSTTALHEAISACCMPAVRYFLSRRFPIYVLDKQRQTPLQVAEALYRDTQYVQLRRPANAIMQLVRQTIAVTNSNQGIQLPLGWTSGQLSSGAYVYHEVHTGSVTFKAPKFSLWGERRLTLGFNKLPELGQRFLIDVVRFVVAENENSNTLKLTRDYVFDDAWFKKDIELTKARELEIPRVVHAARLSALGMNKAEKRARKLFERSSRLCYLVLLSNYVNVLILALPLVPIGVALQWNSGAIVALGSLAIIPLFSVECFSVRELTAKVSKTNRSAVTTLPDSTIELTVSSRVYAYL